MLSEFQQPYEPFSIPEEILDQTDAFPKDIDSSLERLTDMELSVDLQRDSFATEEIEMELSINYFEVLIN